MPAAKHIQWELLSGCVLAEGKLFLFTKRKKKKESLQEEKIGQVKDDRK